MTDHKLVVDASAVVELLRGTTLGDRVAAELRGGLLVAPSHLDAEVLSALGRLSRAAVVADRLVARALAALTTLPIARYPLPPLLERAWSLRHNVALRDGLYVACAEAVDAEVVTIDDRLARSVPGRVRSLR